MQHHVEVHQKPEVGWWKKDGRLCFYILVWSRCGEFFVDVLIKISPQEIAHVDQPTATKWSVNGQQILTCLFLSLQLQNFMMR